MLALHSLSKRDNFAGARIGFYAGDAELVHYLREVRKHAGLMPPGPVQHAAAVALADDEHVEAAARAGTGAGCSGCARCWPRWGCRPRMPDGAFYLWCAAPDGDAWAATRMLAERTGIVASPGEFYGSVSTGYLRLAAVAPDDRIELAARRVGCLNSACGEPCHADRPPAGMPLTAGAAQRHTGPRRPAGR